MGKDKNNTAMTDPELDRLMGLYETPELDGEGFNQKLFARLGQEGATPADTGNQRFVIWSAPRRLAALAVVLLLSAGLLFSNYDFKGEGSEQIQTASVAGETEMAAAPSENEIKDVDGFLNEIIDQDIAVLEYSVAINAPPEKKSSEEQSGQAASKDNQDVPPIDSFLDELLGIESRTL